TSARVIHAICPGVRGRLPVAASSPPRPVPGAGRQIVKPNQVDILAAAVFCDLQEIVNAFEPRFTRQIVSDVANGYRIDRIDDDVALVHGVAAAHFDVRTRPDADA